MVSFSVTDVQCHEVCPAVCPDSRKPPRELLWKTDPKGPPMGLRHHLEESSGGILLEQSGTSQET